MGVKSGKVREWIPSFFSGLQHFSQALSICYCVRVSHGEHCKISNVSLTFKIWEISLSVGWREDCKLPISAVNSLVMH